MFIELGSNVLRTPRRLGVVNTPVA